MHRSLSWSRRQRFRGKPTSEPCGSAWRHCWVKLLMPSTLQPRGKIITGSEEKVRDLFADLSRQAFEQAVQMRMDAGSRFSPLRRIP